ncbi:MAG TPA: hypothetical protein PLK31_15340, partial [Chloroflexota bacterium]|nr:hypothetical protein [Chloroflexota bacterium]
VLLNLYSWAVEKKALPDWMVEELLLQYQLPRETSRRLIASGGLIYLLDGLDEVAAAARDASVQAINDLKAQQPASLAVCCRVAEYEGLAAKLNLGTAVRIQPLSDEQIDDYLRRPELKLTAVRQMVKTDAAMQELAQTPLFLSVMTLAYRDMKRADLKQLPTPEARRAHLYDHYVAEMWRRRPLTSNEPYNETQAMTWLANLAHGMTQAEQTTFYMERLQPTWLPTLSMSRRYTQVNGALVGLSSGLLFGLILGSLLGLWSIALESSNVGLDILIIWWLLGLFFGSYLGWKVGRKEAEDSAYKPIELIEKLVWSAPPFKRFLKQFLKESKDLLIGGALGGLLIGLIVESMLKRLSGANAEPNEVASLFGWAGFGVFLGAIVRLYEGLRIIVQTQDSRRISQPNQGIYDSGFNAWRMGSIYALVYGLIFGSTIGLISMAPSRLINGLVFGLIIGLIAGLIGGLDYGGKTFMRHYVLRWLLARQGVLPFPFKDRLLIVYLDTMADRIFLRRVGGGWVFIHRTLLDYFASLHPDATPATTVILNPAGVKNPNDPE